MNFLAHLYLSGSDESLAIGNFIGDFLRKREWIQYPEDVVRGIRLHLQIDAYTDHHPLVMKSKERLREKHHKYSPVIVDIYYDHFLSANFQRYAGVAVEDFAQQMYNLLNSRVQSLPKGVQKILPFMVAHNWLVAYGKQDGLKSVFKGMSKRAAFDNRMAEAVEDLNAHYGDFQDEFEHFFPDLENMVADWLSKN